MDARQLGRAAKADRCMGRRPLDAQIARLGLDPGPLAIAETRCRVFARWQLKSFDYLRTRNSSR